MRAGGGMITTLFVGMWGVRYYTSNKETIWYRNQLEEGLTFEQFVIVMILLYGGEYPSSIKEAL